MIRVYIYKRSLKYGFSVNVCTLEHMNKDSTEFYKLLFYYNYYFFKKIIITIYINV